MRGCAWGPWRELFVSMAQDGFGGDPASCAKREVAPQRHGVKGGRAAPVLKRGRGLAQGAAMGEFSPAPFQVVSDSAFFTIATDSLRE